MASGSTAGKKNIPPADRGPAASAKEKGSRLAAVIVLAVCALLFAGAWLFLHRKEESGPEPTEFVEYETARVEMVLTDSTFRDEVSDGAYRGEQMLIVLVRSGRYKGEQLQAYNYVGPLYGVPVKEGDNVILTVSTYTGGEHRATVFEVDRFIPILIVLGLFILITVLIGRKTGARSLLALALTILCLFTVLLPALLHGAPTILTTLLVSLWIIAVSLTVIGGLQRKTLCAMAGTAAGTLFAAGFAVLAQSLLRINGLRISDVEPLLQLRQTGESAIGLKGLLTAGIIISALGAVMDVAMSISSALAEVHEANPDYGRRQLFRSGMNIGRDMVGTMTNTLILAFLGSGFTLILYLSSLDISFRQITSSAYASLEIISGISCSAGLILAIPLTALISSFLLTKKA
ncbi:MAG: YibE/F family protein [Lachnospiraceae bacterium]|nr:YibE/F family protein [Lachnospiraceae bacterium]